MKPTCPKFMQAGVPKVDVEARLGEQGEERPSVADGGPHASIDDDAMIAAPSSHTLPDSEDALGPDEQYEDQHQQRPQELEVREARPC